jgi:hypothetical protein
MSQPRMNRMRSRIVETISPAIRIRVMAVMRVDAFSARGLPV